MSFQQALKRHDVPVGLNAAALISYSEAVMNGQLDMCQLIKTTMD